MGAKNIFSGNGKYVCMHVCKHKFIYLSICILLISPDFRKCKKKRKNNQRCCFVMQVNGNGRGKVIQCSYVVCCPLCHLTSIWSCWMRSTVSSSVVSSVCWWLQIKYHHLKLVSGSYLEKYVETDLLQVDCVCCLSRNLPTVCLFQ